MGPHRTRPSTSGVVHERFNHHRPASDAVEGTEDYKGVFALQGENAAVTTNFMENQQGPGGDVITEVVSLNGDDYVQKYENLGYVAIRPEAPITIGELTTPT